MQSIARPKSLAASAPWKPRPVYLFYRRADDTFAVTGDRTGLNIAGSRPQSEWALCLEFDLSWELAPPIPILAEPVVRALGERGFFIWRGWSGSQRRPSPIR